ncbi:MFS transporter [Ligilactobacillus sp. LYQ60]|uniref:MFS transporter n=1 Tax=unclassified Ligilactobacillus TaxID=2767920 RepID=UPI0038530742
MGGSQQTIRVATRPFGLRDKLGYMFGDAGNCFSFMLISSFFMIFCTNVLGLTGAQVGLAFLIARFVDAIADVSVGRFVDNSKLHKKGRFAPWMDRMKYPLLVSIILLFMPYVRALNITFRLCYVYVLYILWGILYSSVNIPYGSMASVISDNPDDKTSLSTFRSVGSSLANMVVSYLLPMLIYVGASRQVSGSRFLLCAVICALCAYCCYTLTTTLTTERIRTNKTSKVPLGRLLKGFLKDPALVILVFIDMSLVVNLMMSGTTSTYLFSVYFHSKVALSINMMLGTGVTFILAPFSRYLTKTFGRKECSAAGLALSVIVYLVLFLIHTRSILVFIILNFIGTVGMGIFNLMVWAFITDVTDNHEIITGTREDGVVYGVNSFARKVAQAIAGGAGGFMLSIIGYKSSTVGAIVQNASVANRLYDMAVIVPLVCSLIACILLVIYPLNKQKVTENAKKLAEIHENNMIKTNEGGDRNER